MFREPVYLVDGARSPFIKSRNRPGPFSAADLAVHVGQQLMLRQPFSPTVFDEVIMACTAPSPDEANIARIIALRMGCGERMSAWTVMRNCASGLQAIDSAINSILAGRSHLVLAGGVDALSRAPLVFNNTMVNWFSDMAKARTMGQRLSLLCRLRPRFFSPIIGLLRGLTDPFTGLIMGQTAENVAHDFGISRSEMDNFAVRSHLLAHKAHEEGRFAEELCPIIDSKGHLYDRDDGVRGDSSVDKLAKLKPFFDKPYGQVTAANSSQVTDGAALVILASQTAVERYGLTPLAKITDTQWAGLDPSRMGLGPVHATQPLLARNRLALSDIDSWEINEAFSAQVIGCLRAFNDEAYCQKHFSCSAMGSIADSTLNVDGGAVAVGHPVSASGPRIVLHLAHTMKRLQHRRGIANICIGGGQGGALLLEGIDHVEH